jgi:hypothetical protein
VGVGARAPTCVRALEFAHQSAYDGPSNQSSGVDRDMDMKEASSKPPSSSAPPLLGWKTAIVIVPVATVAIAKTLAGFASIIQEHLAIQYDFWFELGMVVGQVLFQWCVLWRRSWRERLDYALILLFVSGLGSVLLWPLLLLNHVAQASHLVAVGYFFVVVGVMFAAHWKLVVKSALPTILCATWVIYRLLILGVVLKRP